MNDPFKTHPDRNWHEDFPHENGNYVNKCGECNLYFKGHKRRVRCKKCMTDMKDKVLFENNEFWGLRNCPLKEPRKPEDFETKGGLKVYLGGDFGYSKAKYLYDEVMKASIAAKTRIENHEFLKNIHKDDEGNFWVIDGVASYGLLKDGSIFDLPDNVEFEECEGCASDCCTTDGRCDEACRGPVKFIHLKLKEQVKMESYDYYLRLKEESQDELLIRGDVAAYNHAISDAKLLLYKNGRQVEGRMLDQLIKIEIQRIHPEQ